MQLVDHFAPAMITSISEDLCVTIFLAARHLLLHLTIDGMILV